MSVNQEQFHTREEYKKAKFDAVQRVKGEEKSKKETKAAASEKKQERIRVRLIPIWLRLVLMLVFAAVFMVAGAAVGYGVIGDGKAMDVFKESTWTHIFDLVQKGK